jgi:peptide/nickel transport system substrate-binding protein
MSNRLIHKSFLVLMTIVFLLGGCQTAQSTSTQQPPTEPSQANIQPTQEIPTATKTTEIIQPTSTESSVNKPYVIGLEDTPLYGGTLVVPRWPDFPTCNPAISTDLTVSSVLGNVFDGLMRLNNNLEYEPELATSWDISEDGLTYTFNLRHNVRWHDGEPFTSADVKFSFEEALSTLHPRGKIPFSQIESIDTPDDYTVIFHLKEPTSGFMYQANAPETLIIPKHIYENEDIVEGPHATCQELPIGTGPFKATEYIQGSSFTVVRNDDWWGTEGNYWGVGQPYLDKIVYVFVPDSEARVNGLESGEFDYLSMLMFPRNEYARFGAMDGFTVSLEGMHMIGVMSFYGFNLLNDPVNKLCVRQAIAYAMDLDAINDKVYYGTGFPTMSMFQPTHPEYDINLEPYPYQPRSVEKAKTLLDECGYPVQSNGWRFEIKQTYDMSRAERVDMADIFKQLVEEIGIKVNMDGVDYNIWTDQVYMKHDYDVTPATLGLGWPSVGAARFFLSSNIGEALFNNSAAYSNPEMDELWNTYSTTTDPATRLQAIYRIQEIALEDLPYLFVNASVYPSAWNSAEFAGFHIDTASGPTLMRTVWWKDGTPTP